MQPVTPAEIVRRLQALGGGPDAALAFDGDGTLWSGDVGEDVFADALMRRALHPSAWPALNQLARQQGLAQHPEVHAQADALFLSFREGLLPERDVCEMMAWCFAGSLYSELVKDSAVALGAAFAERRYQALAEVMAWAKETRTHIVVVSASPDFAVEAAVGVWGLSPNTVAACSAAQDSSGRLLAYLARPLPYKEQKVTALRSKVGDKRLLAAFGDNSFDLELLLESEIPVLTRPKPALRELAHRVPQALLLE